MTFPNRQNEDRPMARSSMTKQFGAVLRGEASDITWKRLPTAMLKALVKISKAEKRSDELRLRARGKQNRKTRP
jgi:hypothetical protein